MAQGTAHSMSEGMHYNIPARTSRAPPPPQQRFALRDGGMNLKPTPGRLTTRRVSPQPRQVAEARDDGSASNASGRAGDVGGGGGAGGDKSHAGDAIVDPDAEAHELTAPIETALERSIALIKRRAAAARLGMEGGQKKTGYDRNGVTIKVRQRVLNFDTVRWMEKSLGTKRVNQCILDPDQLEGFKQLFDLVCVGGGAGGGEGRSANPPSSTSPARLGRWRRD